MRVIIRAEMPVWSWCRPVAQIERVMDSNQLSTVTAEVVETARNAVGAGHPLDLYSSV